MPLISIPGAQAVATRKSNPVAYWGNRSPGNRVEPVAKPEFRATFKLEPGERIFTIGSCFAREIEGELWKRGFQLPMMEIASNPQFSSIGFDALNKYTTPSIYNELAWALDSEKPFVPEDHILEVAPGKFVDVHLDPILRPASWEECLSRRTALRDLVRQALECRVLIMTLGLSEVWFDEATGFYLNNTPRPAVLDKYPGRFALHVLSYDETYSYLEKALLLLRSKNPLDLRAILTVSPVALWATHRPMDVMEANTYSKAVLRTAAEAICVRHDWIDYYPSYEAVVLSNRSIAYLDDLVHVTQDIVGVNVVRMLERYLSGSDTIEKIAAAIERGGRLVAEDFAGKAWEKGPAYASAFFERFGAWSGKSPAFALAQAQFLSFEDKHEAAIEVLSKIPPDWEPISVAIARAGAQLGLGRAQDAIDTLSSLVHDALFSFPIWELLVKAYAKSGQSDRAIATAYQSIAATGLGYRPWAMFRLIQALGANDPPRAADLATGFVNAGYDLEEVTADDKFQLCEFVDLLVREQKFDTVRELLTRLRPQPSDIEERLNTLRAMLFKS